MNIYYINLARRTDRNTDMINKLNAINHEYKRFNAIDGQTLELSDSLLHLFRNNDFNYKRGVLGAALSHYYLWKLLLTSDYDYNLILEDDVVLCDNFGELLSNIKVNLEPNNIKLLLLGYTGKSYVSDNIIISKLQDKTSLLGGLFGYIIHKSVIKHILSMIDMTGIYRAIDMYLFDNCCCDIHIVSPQIITTTAVSLYNNVDSDIHYNIMTLYDNYDFYQELDSDGYDISHHPGLSFNKLKELANKTNDCVGFNTLGYLKHKINWPLKKLPFGKFHGIYIKKNI